MFGDFAEELFGDHTEHSAADRKIFDTGAHGADCYANRGAR